FTAHCPLPPPDVQRQFVEQFQRRGRAGLDLEAEVHCNGSRVAEFQGNFVAIRSAKAETCTPSICPAALPSPCSVMPCTRPRRKFAACSTRRTADTRSSFRT